MIVSPATVTLIPADNILLTPRPQQMKALSPLVTPSTDPELDSANGPADSPRGHGSVRARTGAA